VPPIGSALPQARVEGSAVVVQDAAVSASFQWKALTTTTLALTVQAPDGKTAAAGVTASLQSQASGLPSVGTLTIGSGPAMAATGFVRVSVTSDASGLATFNDLPAGQYALTLTPADPGAAVTSSALDLGQPAAQVARTVRLSNPVAINGKLTPPSLAAGVTVVALDPDADPLRPVSSARADGAGLYRLVVDPGRPRPYRLFVEPAPDADLPRTPLGPAPVTDTSFVMGDRQLARGVPITGVIRIGGVPTADVVLQAYCMSDSPDCVPMGAVTSTEGLRPMAEAVSGPDGAFRLVVPDPSVVF
jgi:hypothetical protein